MTYYDYIKKYNAQFLNNYTSWTHFSWGRGSNFMQLLNFRAFNLNTNRVSLVPGYKIKSTPSVLIGIYCLIAVYGIWISQDIYNRFSPRKATYYDDEEEDEISFRVAAGGSGAYEEKMPINREEFADKYDFSYGGLHNQVNYRERRYRYR